jgi:hypothetical protein
LYVIGSWLRKIKCEDGYNKDEVLDLLVFFHDPCYLAPCFISTRPHPVARVGWYFWIYEQAVRIPFYAIYEVEKARVTVYQLVNGRYQLCPANDQGHYPIPPLGLELGIWDGVYMNQTFPWLRWWDDQGNLLLAAYHSGSRLLPTMVSVLSSKLHYFGLICLSRLGF